MQRTFANVPVLTTTVVIFSGFSPIHGQTMPVTHLAEHSPGLEIRDVAIPLMHRLSIISVMPSPVETTTRQLNLVNRLRLRLT
jgi:hypothetical protein